MVVRGICGFGVRHLQCLLLSLTYSTFYIQMLAPELCLLMISYSDKKFAIQREKFLRSPKDDYGSACLERMLMAISAVATGIWSVHKGVKYLILGVGIFGTVIMYFISLFVRVYGYRVLIISDLIFYVIKGFLAPLIYSLLSKWLPDNEKGRLTQVIFPGKFFGLFLQYTVGYYLGKPKDEWVQTLFWSGNCGVLWAIAWCSFGANHPKECFYIDRNERKYIQEHQRYTAKYGVVKEIPWTNIFLTIELYPVIFAHACLEWANEVATAHMDFYLIFIHKQNLDSITKVESYGLLLAMLIALPVGFIVDKLTSKNVALSKIRKVVTCVGMWGAGMTLPFLGHAPSLTWAKCMVAFYTMFATPVFVGVYLTFLDFSPNFCGILFGISSAFAYIATLGVPLVRSALVVDNADIVGWNKFLYTAALAYYLGALIYSLFTTVEIKSFNALPTEKPRY